MQDLLQLKQSLRSKKKSSSAGPSNSASGPDIDGASRPADSDEHLVDTGAQSAYT